SRRAAGEGGGGCRCARRRRSGAVLSAGGGARPAELHAATQGRAVLADGRRARREGRCVLRMPDADWQSAGAIRRREGEGRLHRPEMLSEQGGRALAVEGEGGGGEGAEGHRREGGGEAFQRG